MEATVKKSGNGVLKARALDRLNLFVARVCGALPNGNTVSLHEIQCLLNKEEALLAHLSEIEVTDDLESPQHATALHSMTLEKLIRTWQELLKVRILILPLTEQLYGLAPALRLAARAVDPGSERGIRISILAEEFGKHALRLDAEYQWLECQMCPGIAEALHPERTGRAKKK